MNALLRKTDLFGPLQAEFDRFFDEFFKDRRSFIQHLKASSSFPKMDIFTRGGKLIARVAVSGMTKDDISVTVSDTGYVTVEGRIAGEYIPDEGDEMVLKELRTSAFRRNFQLPQEMEYEGTTKPSSAKVENGILTLEWLWEFPQEEAIREPTKVEIE